MDYRRDTAASAALSLSHRNQKEDDNQTEVDNQDTSIDDILGPRMTNTDKESDMSDEGSQRTGSPSDSNSIQTQSPEPEATSVNNEVPKLDESENTVEEAKKLKEGEDEQSEPKPPTESSETVENQTNSQSSDDVVVTSVTVEVNGDAPVAVCDENECNIKNQKNEADKGTDTSKTEGESQEAKELGETSENNGRSTLAVEQEAKEGGGEGEGGEEVEVLITHDQRSNSFSVNVANIDTDDYSSSEDESTQPPPYIKPPAESEAAVTSSPSQEVTSSEEPPKANGDCPTITVETEKGEKKGAKDEEGKPEKRNSSASNSSTEGERLSPPIERRRCKFFHSYTALHEIFIMHVHVYLVMHTRQCHVTYK